MAERTEVTFAELGQIFDGPHATPERINEGPYFLNIASLNNGRLDLTQSDHVSPTQFTQWTRRVTPRENDLLFSYETKLGEAALMPAGVEACLGRRMALLRPDTHVVDPRFLLYLYISPTVKQIIETNTIHGATVNRIALSTMSGWRVQLPQLHDQRMIGSLLGAVDDKIATNARAMEVIDQLAGLEVELQSHQCSEHRLAEIATLTMGSSPPGQSYNSQGQGVPFHQGIKNFDLRWPATTTWTTSPVRLARAGDALVSVRAPVGRVNRARTDICIGRGLAAASSKTGNPLLLFHLLRSATEEWAPFEAEGTIYGSINRDQLASVKLPFPTPSRALELEQRLTALEGHLASKIAESEALATLRDTLLPALMSGRLRLRDAERIVEDAT